MKTNEKILEQFKPNQEYPSYYHEANILQAMKESNEAVIQKCAEIASYKGGLNKAETWSLGKDEIHDRIEELILELKNEIK